MNGPGAGASGDGPVSVDMHFRRPPFLSERDVENPEEVFLFETDVRACYQKCTVEEDMFMKNYLKKYAEKRMMTGERQQQQQTATSSARSLPRDSTGRRISSPQQQQEQQQQQAEASSSAPSLYQYDLLPRPRMTLGSCEAFWKDPAYGYTEEVTEEVFAQMKEYTYFKEGREASNAATLAGTMAQRSRSGRQDPVGLFLSKAEQCNILSKDQYFDSSVPFQLRQAIMESVEFYSLFSVLSILQTSGKLFEKLHDDLSRELNMHGCHYSRSSTQEFVAANEASGASRGNTQYHTSSLRQAIIEYSIDPSFLIKKEEKIDRKKERQERRTIRMLSRKDRRDERYLPRSQADPPTATAQASSIRSIGPDGDAFSDSSSGSDSDEDGEEEALRKLIVEAREDFSRKGLRNRQEVETERRMEEEMAAGRLPETDLFMQKVNTLSRHVHMPMSYSISDHNMRQFLDTHLRILVLLTNETDEEACYEIKKFLFFIAQH